MHQFRCRVIGQYGTFTTAKVQPGKAGLVRHTLTEPQGIDQGSVFTLIGKDTTPAQSRAEFSLEAVRILEPSGLKTAE